MCGIAGILRVWPTDRRDEALATPPGAAIPDVWLNVLDDSIRHRGPDGHGRFRDRAVRADGCVVDVALVHRRLSIIDHAGGHQPMVWAGPSDPGAPPALGTPALRAGRPSPPSPSTSPGRLLTPAEIESYTHAISTGQQPASLGPDSRPHRRIAVVFNGCIYNHRDLRTELQRAGHTFSTDHSDTEVLVHGWREWGSDLWPRLDGMFAAVIWDWSRGAVFFARDGFGEKPLYTRAGRRRDEWLAFASTPVGPLRLPLAPHAAVATPDDRWRRIKPWVKFGWNQWSPTPEVAEVSPGTAAAFPESPDHPATPWTGFWGEVLRTDGFAPLSAHDAETHLRAAVTSRLEADVPLGTFLSGGIDSALVTAFAKTAHPDLTAYTVRMPGGVLDESDAAAATARALGVRHRVLDCDPRPADDLVALIRQLGLPFGDSSLLPTCWVSRAAGREVKVALAGDGGDEMFLGYDRHRAIRVLTALARWPRDARRGMAEMLPLVGHPRRRLDRVARLLNAAAYDGYKELVAIFPPPLDAALGLRPRDQHGWGAIQHFGMTVSDGSDDEPFGATIRMTALRFDRMFYLPFDLLRKTDTASMSVPLEVRAPFLEPTLARAAMAAPMTSLMPRHQRKGLLRQVARRYLPATIVDRPKMGFAIPIGEWFRSDYGGLRTMLLDHLNSAEPFGPPSLGIDLDMTYIRRMLDEHLGTGPSGRVTRDHSQRLYMLLVLSIWARWVGGLR